MTTPVTGTQKHGYEDTVNQPLLIGGHASTSVPSVVDNNDAVRAYFDEYGMLVVTLGRNLYGEDATNSLFATHHKPVSVGTYAWSIDASAALEASSVIKASPGNVYRLTGRIDSTIGNGTYYFQLINATSVPGDGAVTLIGTPIKIIHTTGTDSKFEKDYTPSSVFGSLGLVWCLSTTEFTKTTGAGVTGSVEVLYK